MESEEDDEIEEDEEEESEMSGVSLGKVEDSSFFGGGLGSLLEYSLERLMVGLEGGGVEKPSERKKTVAAH